MNIHDPKRRPILAEDTDRLPDLLSRWDRDHQRLAQPGQGRGAREMLHALGQRRRRLASLGGGVALLLVLLAWRWNDSPAPRPSVRAVAESGKMEQPQPVGGASETSLVANLDLIENDRIWKRALADYRASRDRLDRGRASQHTIIKSLAQTRVLEQWLHGPSSVP